MLYPVNSVAWSLALELTVNAVYAIAWRQLRKPVVLGASLAISAAALVAAVAWFGKLDIGFLWRDWIGGLPRVAFSFTAGLAVYQLYRRRAWALKAPAWVTLAGLPVVFCLPLGQTVYPLACVLLLFPALVFAVASAPEPGARQARLFTLLGAASYPLYALHKPLGELVVLGLRHGAPQMIDRTPLLTGAPYLVALMAGSLLVERWFDRPARKALNAGVGQVSRVLRQWAGVRLEPFPAAKAEDAVAER
jgi:peptidoglycan/LPS O-acetylase OafA/YrhL